MNVTIPCPHCKAPLGCPAEAHGKLLRCKKCQHVFRAALPTPTTDVFVAEVVELPLGEIVEPLDAEVVEPLPEAVPVARAAPQPLPPRPRRMPPVEDVGEMLCWRGNRVDGLTGQKGVIVLRPTQVAFVPSEKAWNLAADVAAVAVDAVSPVQTVPISVDWLRDRPDPLRLVNDLWDEYHAEFDACLVQVVNRLGGLVWPRDEVEVVRHKPFLIGMSEAVVFLRGGAELRGYAPPRAALNRLLEGWALGDPPIFGDMIAALVVSLLPLLLAAGLFVGHLTLTDPEIPWWAPLIGLGLAGLIYLAVGLKAVVLLRRRRSRRV
jgi:hypothetical protein